MRKRGPGTWQLAAANTAWDGPLLIEGGQVELLHSMSLASSNRTSVFSGASLTLVGNVSLFNDRLVLDGGSLGADGRAEVLSPISVVGETRISATDQLDLLGPIVGSGSIHFEGGLIEVAGRLGGGNHYAGHTWIDQGALRIQAASALGSPTEGTTIGGQGELRIARNVELSGEPLRLEGGTLRFDTSPLGAIDTSIHFVQDGQIKSLVRSLQVRGEWTGPAGILIDQSEGRVTLNNTGDYGGTTVLRSSEVMAMSAEALGSPKGLTVIEWGQLWIKESGPTDEPLTVRDGAGLLLETPTYNGPITLEQGKLVPVKDSSDVTITRPIVVKGQGTIDNRQSRLHLVGGITGAGDVVLSGGERIEILDVISIDGTLKITGEVVLTSPQHFQNRVIVDNGRLWTEVDVEFDELVIGPDGGLVSTVDDAVVTIHGFNPGHATWDLNLNVTEPIVVDHTDGPTFKNLGAAMDQEIVVRQGHVYVSGANGLGGNERGTRLESLDRAAIELKPGVEITESIDLNNATGIGGHGALTTGMVHGQNDTTPATLRGRLDLGEVGSVIGGGGHPDLRLEGAIEGGTLTKRGNLHLIIATADVQYTGDTHLGSGITTLVDEGSLSSTARIVVDGRLAELRLDDLGTVADNDRVADEIPIVMRGGRIEGMSPSGKTTSEDLGPVHLESGHSAIFNRGFGWGKDGASMQLTIQSLTRDQGAVVHLNALRIDAPVELKHGIIGGWALFGNQFATVIGNRVNGIEDTSENLNDPVMGHHVFQQNSIVLDGDRQPATIFSNRDIDVDLNTHTLNVLTGGLSLDGRIKIHNGVLTAGTEADSEIFLHGNASVEATIADNEQGPVNLVVSAMDNRTLSGAISLSGQNTYSGSTTVNGSLIIEDPKALPAGTDIWLSGGDLTLTNAQYSVGQVRVRDNGSFFGHRGTTVQATGWRFESGTLTEVLSGESPLIKTSPGMLRLRGNHQSYDGTILIREGTVAAFDFYSLGTGQTIVESGTRLGVGAMRSGNVVLNGGQLFSLWAGDRGGYSVSLERLDVVADSSIVLRNILDVDTIGGADLRIRGPLRGEGKLLIEGPNRDLVFEGDNSEYSGEWVINGATVTVLHEQGLRNHRTTVHRLGVLSLGLDGNAIPGNVYLNGGTLQSDFFNANTHFAGDLEVSGESFLRGGDLRLSGRIQLNDHAHLKKQGDGRLRINGLLAVGRDTMFEVMDGQVDLLGTVTSNGADSLLKLIDADNFIRFHASVQIPDGETLQVIHHGEPLTIAFDSPNQVLSGAGALRNRVLLERGAKLIPGSGAAELTIDGDLQWNGGVLHWDIQSAEVASGRWDRVTVTGDVALGPATSTIQVAGVDGASVPIQGFDPLVDYEWTIVQGQQILGFADAEFIVDSTAFESSHPLVRHGQFDVVSRVTHLSLVYDANESLGDFNGDGVLDATDVDLLSQAIRDGSEDRAFDLNLNGEVETTDRIVWVEQVRRTYFGDSDLDGVFSSSDLVLVFAQGKYEDGTAQNVGWASGDWNGDAGFTSSDLVIAFQRGGYELEPRREVFTVPEPTSQLTFTLIMATFVVRRRRCT